MTVTSEQRSYFFPILFLVPDFEPRTVEDVGYRLTKRAWETSIFDLALLVSLRPALEAARVDLNRTLREE